MLGRALVAVAVAGCYHRVTAQSSPGDARDGGALDGTGDALPDANFSCWLGVTPPTNFRPCDGDWPMAKDPLSIPGASSFNTDTGMLGGIAAPGGPYSYDGVHTVWLAHVKSVTVSATLTIQGQRPLVIVSDGPIMISGTIDASAIHTQPCGQRDGTNGFIAAGGGGGGGDGTGGGSGGSGVETGTYPAGGPGGPASGTATLSPLLPGCPGGSGGGASGAGAGAPGRGGGALELVSVMSIDIAASTGKITAGGEGAQPGSSQTVCQSSFKCAGGGGGGGAGGAVLLEAPTIAIETGATVCAAGGGGGQGAAQSSVTPCGGGATGDCSRAAGGSSCTGGYGGASSNDSTMAASPGSTGSFNSGGGGGGGGAGWIRLHSTSTPAISGTVRPMPVY